MKNSEEGFLVFSVQIWFRVKKVKLLAQGHVADRALRPDHLLLIPLRIHWSLLASTCQSNSHSFYTKDTSSWPGTVLGTSSSLCLLNRNNMRGINYYPQFINKETEA